MEKKKSFIDDCVKKETYKPPVGNYDEIKPTYIRGAQQLSSQFVSSTDRFKPQISTNPGPGEYFQPIQPVQVVQVKPKYIRPDVNPDDYVSSIPYDVPVKQKTELHSERSKWITETVGNESLTNPNPNSYVSEKQPLPRESQVNIQVGGGGTSLARYEHQSSWAKAPERLKEQHAKSAKVGPGTYNLQSEYQFNT